MFGGILQHEASDHRIGTEIDIAMLEHSIDIRAKPYLNHPITILHRLTTGSEMLIRSKASHQDINIGRQGQDGIHELEKDIVLAHHLIQSSTRENPDGIGWQIRQSTEGF